VGAVGIVGGPAVLVTEPGGASIGGIIGGVGGGFAGGGLGYATGQAVCSSGTGSGGDSGGGGQSGGARGGGSNQSANAKFAEAVRRIEKARGGQKLSPDQIRRLHDELHSFPANSIEEIVNIGLGLFH